MSGISFDTGKSLCFCFGPPLYPTNHHVGPILPGPLQHYCRAGGVIRGRGGRCSRGGKRGWGVGGADLKPLSRRAGSLNVTMYTKRVLVPRPGCIEQRLEFCT